MSRLKDALLGDRLYPQSPGFKAPGPSRDAARAVAPKVANWRKQILDLLRLHPSGLTADEIGNAVSMSLFAVRPRVSELRRLGLIESTGERRRNASGLFAHVWRIARHRPAEGGAA